MFTQCNFKYKGNRKYVHSTDIYKFLQKKYSRLSSLEFLIKSKSKNQLLFKDNIQDNVFDRRDIFCKGKLNIKRFIFLKSKKKIKHSYKFDENKYDKLFEVNKNFIKCKTLIKDDFIDLIICMINYIHKKKFPRKKYLLVKLIQLKKIQTNSLKMQNLKIRTTVNNHSPISLNKVYLNNKTILEIVYINN